MLTLGNVREPMTARIAVFAGSATVAAIGLTAYHFLAPFLAV